MKYYCKIQGLTPGTEVVGEAAITFSPEELSSLKHSVESIIFSDQLYMEMSKKSLAEAAKFNWRSTAEKTVGLLRHVLGEAKD